MTSFDSLKTSLNIFKDTYRHLMLSRAPEASYSSLKRSWADHVLANIRAEVDLSGTVSLDRPLLLVGNHISYLDIPLLMKVAPDISFVAKDEVASWPFFGAGARKIDTIFVKRDCGDSRTAARRAIRDGLQNKKRIVLFPSGTTSLSESKPWRRGAFEIARESGVKLQPFRISYSPLRAAAYIDKDFFPLHLFQLGRQEKIIAKIEFHEPVHVTDAAADTSHWQAWAQGALPR